ncbi:2-succinyl-5-enolpyruvyl-6-hydroxy-3-cyclohexene-1-carboxylic-acid synthase [Nocardioides rotundus]|uniref:2-succinyl-5-enolpyruvyl-6-hydroxy-3- cyclohexene-1-carboxylic-acid synthase n=1 Tax=Nocardioides rotundus TaxID=1774216 RepID=UPI001CBC1CD7|nr:2-succinyl-5-enolpyruvyl-6-hydroxy-3-cyclohexene-1-carboxylic-acid synthase [Nocardioides rotundus]UAL29325.1 2-succinyl-5-enolpyruvyl-6-hydroxy-3-cyclohexene-1-carboxylic-acid synthase [Nocardioides rotundus]
MTDSTTLARDVLRALVEAGVREVVLAPGSRNAPLAFAAHDAAEAGALRLHTRLDERTAGFLALGLTKGGSRAAVVCTSGTAVANLHPAMLEAAHAGVALVAVTADRPMRLRGTSANQTTRQPGIFGPDVAGFDLAAEDTLPDDLDVADRPVHLNLQLDEPLMPDGAWTDPPGRAERRGSAWRRTDEPVTIPTGPRTLVVAGDDAGPPARVLAEQAGWPLLAEPSSGSRTGENAIRTYRLLLAGELGERVERAVVFGHPTLSRPVTRLLGRADVEVWARAPEPGVATRRPFEVARTFSTARADADDADWLAEWKAADADVSRRLDTLLAAEPGVTPHEVAGAVSAAVPPDGLLVVGASSPIRDLDLMVAKYAVGDRRKVIANRGLAGIDGTVSTAIGAALGRPSSRAFALMGDVTFLHDTTGLMLGPVEERPDLTIVVANDDGGSIFTMLEQGAVEYADRYDRLFGLPHGVDLAALCAATRTPHWRVESLPELQQALASPNGGIEVVEVRVRRHDRRALDERIRGLVATT